MTQPSKDSRLNRINTRWSVVHHALAGSKESARTAQEQLLEHYGKAIHRYLLGALRDSNAADELYQIFAQRLIEGKLSGAAPERGRFRDFVKGVLSHLITDYHARRAREATRSPALVGDLAAPATGDEREREVTEWWRSELLDRAWAALAELDKQTNQSFFDVLRLRADQPELRSAQLAELLAERLGKPITTVAVRQLLHRARDRFAALLLAEVAFSLGNPPLAELEEELIELRLLPYCQAALTRLTR